MAPSRPARPGFSRRAQWGLFAGYVVAITGIVVAIGLVAIAQLDPAGFARVRGGALDITAPLTGAGRSVVDAFGRAGAGISAYVDAGRQNAGLLASLEEAQGKLIRARVTERENARLRQALALRDRAPGTIVMTRIVGSTATSTRRLATILAGSADGVRPGQPVRATEGLVGRVFETGAHAARLLLVTDGGSTIPVQLARGGLPALATGDGNGGLRLRALLAGQNPFRRGDLAITSGTGGIFAPGVPVAVVVRVDNDGAVARPLADPARLDFVAIEPVYAPETLLPPPGLPREERAR